MTSSDIRFDEKVLDVGMAKEYLKQNSEFHSTKDQRDQNIIVEHDDYNNKIFLKECGPRQCYLLLKVPKDINLKLMDLAEKIIENLDLFCQLEYLIRKVPMDETKNIELKLLTQNLIYQSSHEDVDIAVISEIRMNATTPLSILGCMAQAASQVTIVSTKETAVVCSLFVDLCHKVGLESIVSLLLVKTPEPPSGLTLSWNFKEIISRSVGIVTEKADIDSAVDAFLYSTSRDPWRIGKIYVQECVLGRFKRSLEWKTKKMPEDVGQSIRPYTSAHAYDDKEYLFEFVGNESELGEKAVVIEAFRTNKELISLLSTKRPLCVSLWSSDVAASNEIAFAIDSNIVWINDFAYFEGPPIVSQGFYSPLLKIESYKRIKDFEFDKEDISKLRARWLQSDLSMRYLKIQKAFQKFLVGREIYKDVMDLKLNNNSRIDVGKKVCVSIRSPLDILPVVISRVEDIFEYLNCIIDGAALLFIVKTPDVGEVAELYKLLADVSAPVGWVKKFSHLEPDTPYAIRYNTKIIWSSVGTIFAN